MVNVTIAYCQEKLLRYLGKVNTKIKETENNLQKFNNTLDTAVKR